MNVNTITKKAVIRHESGLHARIAAMVVQKTHEIQKKYNTTLFIQKNGADMNPIGSLMLLISLKILSGDQITVSASGNMAEAAVDEMITFLESDFNITDNIQINSVDTLLQDNVVTTEYVFNSMANGLIAIDENGLITLFNPTAEKTFNILTKDVIGKNIANVIPELRLGVVSKTNQPEIGLRQNVGNSTIVTKSTPIVVNGKSKGAVCIFEDISELVNISWELTEIKELKEKYQLILDSVQEGICVVDKDGYISYVNSAYSKILDQEPDKLLGFNLKDISPNGARYKALLTGQQLLGSISKKPNGVTIISNVNPIIVDGELTGVVSVINDISEIKNLMDKLSHVSAKAEYLEQELIRAKKLGPEFDRIIGTSGKMMDAMAVSAKAAKGIYTVMIRGESGTGKELVAEAIHFSSSRAKGPFIRVNCAAIPSSLLESELFGHEKGAFTGAIKTKLGRFELANKGTIFLDEIGEMEKNMQVKLLRVIQKKEFQRVGGEETLKVDVRIIAATNQNLEEMLKSGDFREDLYYRLNVIPIFLPPLRDRKEDIPHLADYFLKKISAELGKVVKGLSRDALDILLKYRWPGNVRELENIMERTITLLESEYIESRELPDYIREVSISSEVPENRTVFPPNDIILPWEDYEKQIIKMALEKYGSFNAAGKALGLTHKTIAAKAQKFGIEKTIAWDKVSRYDKSTNKVSE